MENMGLVPPSSPSIGDTRFNTIIDQFQIFGGEGWRTMVNYKHYFVLEEGRERNGVRWFGVECSDELQDWLYDTYAVGIDFYINRTLKGVWFDVPEQILTMIKLKW